MQLRALAHRSSALSLEAQHAALTGHRVFTTRSQKPREHVEDPVEYLEDSDDEALPSLAEQAGLVGYLSECSDPDDEDVAAPLSPCSAWESEGDYPAHVRVFNRPMADVLRDADIWQQSRAAIVNTAASSAESQPSLPTKKRVRRGGKSTKSRKTWTLAQREAEKASVAYGARTALLRECRRLQRLEERSDSAASHAAKFVGEAEHYSSSFKLSGLISTGSPFVSSRRAPAGSSGYTSQVFRSGFCALGIEPTSRTSINFILRVARGPSPGCNEYVRTLVREHGFAYIPNTSVSQVFTDSKGVIYAVKPAQPSGDAWPQQVVYLLNLLRTLHAELKLSKPENINHQRGHFDRISWGTSHGGGRKHPTTITPDWKRNKQLLVDFFKDPIMQRTCRHIQNCLFTWLPDVALFYTEVQQELKDSGIDLQAVFGPGASEFNLPFVAHRERNSEV
ncbi:hypothetical protein AURDEDRAFT_172252 [Auricularia subglabra TFB-10046 SS5]|nr:hypothetical protein AURDEDRAFT_172252 [Auricularia subglabra TFB-10046 SS5]